MSNQIMSVEEHNASIATAVAEFESKGYQLSESGGGILPESFEAGETYDAIVTDARVRFRQPTKDELKDKRKGKLLIKVSIDDEKWNCKVDRGFLFNPAEEQSEVKVVCKSYTPEGSDITYKWLEL